MIFIFQEHANNETSTREVAATTLIPKISSTDIARLDV
jgi:hypothetical protein